MNEEFKEYLEEQRRLVAQDARLNEWLNLTDAGLRLRCGELTAKEICTVRAVLKSIYNPKTAVSNAEPSTPPQPRSR